MKVILLIKGSHYEIYDIDDRFKKFMETLDEDKASSVIFYLTKLADEEIEYKPKCFPIKKGIRICELKPKATKNQVRIFVYRLKKCVYIIDGLVKKTNTQRKEREFYKNVAKIQKRIKEELNG